MKGVFIFLILGLFFCLIGVYIFQNFSPFEISKIDEIIKSGNIDEDTPEILQEEVNNIINRGLVLDLLSTNAYLLLGVVSAALFSLLVSIHLFIDKVFFKSLWEKPSLLNALRRALLVIISLDLIIYLRILSTELITLILIPIAAIIFEVIFNNIKVDFNNLILKGLNPKKVEESVNLSQETEVSQEQF